MIVEILTMMNSTLKLSRYNKFLKKVSCFEALKVYFLAANVRDTLTKMA